MTLALPINESDFLSIYSEFTHIACSNPGVIESALSVGHLRADETTYGAAAPYVVAAYAAWWIARSACGRDAGMVLDDGKTIYDATIESYQKSYGLSLMVI